MRENIRLYAGKYKTNKEQPVLQKPKSALSRSPHMDSPVDRLLYLQQTIGNQAVTQLIQSGTPGAIQAELLFGQPGDIYEQEAERAAEQATVPRQKQTVTHDSPHIRRQEDEPPKKAEKGKKSIEYHIVTQDEDLKIGGAPTHESLEGLKNALMKNRKKDDSQWALWVQMHGWEDVLAYRVDCQPDNDDNPCLTISDLHAIFLTDQKWLEWRKKYGPWKVVFLSCFLTDDMASAVEEIFLRPGAPRTAVGKSLECHTEILDIPINIGDRNTHIKTRKQYNSLSIENKRVFMDLLHNLKKVGYCDIDTRKMADQELLHYYFNEDPKGLWLKCTVTRIFNGKVDFSEPLYKYKKSSLFHSKCAPVKLD
jgi:hypothetical protein